MIDHVEDGVRLPVVHAVADGGQVGRGIEERPVLLADDHRRPVAFEKHADGAVADAGQPAVEQFLDDGRKLIVIETLAQRVIELDAQPPIDPLNVFEADGEEFPPQAEVFRVAGVQLGGFGQHGRGDVGVLVGQRADLPIKPGQLLDRGPAVRLAVQEMLVAVKDHAELRAPVADVIVADHFVAGEPQHPPQGVADHGGADMADVHRLGDVGGRIVQHEPSRPRTGATPSRGSPSAAANCPASQGVRMRTLMNPGPATSGGSQRSDRSKRADQLGGHLARRPTQPLPQRHGKVGLVIAELGVLAAADHRQQFFRVVGHSAQGGAKRSFNVERMLMARMKDKGSRMKGGERLLASSLPSLHPSSLIGTRWAWAQRSSRA